MATPRQKSENMPNDKSLAERLFQVLRTCGRKAIVVNIPAVRPKSCVVFIVFVQNLLVHGIKQTKI